MLGRNNLFIKGLTNDILDEYDNFVFNYRKDMMLEDKKFQKNLSQFEKVDKKYRDKLKPSVDMYNRKSKRIFASQYNKSKDSISKKFKTSPKKFSSDMKKFFNKVVTDYKTLTPVQRLSLSDLKDSGMKMKDYDNLFSVREINTEKRRKEGRAILTDLIKNYIFLNEASFEKGFLSIPINQIDGGKINEISSLFEYLFLATDQGCQKKLRADGYEFIDGSDIACTNGFAHIMNKFKSIGVQSVNGIVFQGSFKSVPGSNFVVKTNVKKNGGDELDYEYDVQQRLNGLRRHIPNFSLAYGIFSCNESDEIRKLRGAKDYKKRIEKKLDATNRKHRNYKAYLQKFKDVEYDLQSMKTVGALCNKNTNRNNAGSIYTVSEIVNNPITLGDYSMNGAESYKDVVDALLQVTCALVVAQSKKSFCHYDLHADNVLLQKIQQFDTSLKDTTDVIFNYEMDNPNIPNFFVNVKYLAVLIDFGRSYVPDKAMGYDRNTNPDYEPFSSYTNITPNRFNGLHDICRLWPIVLYNAIYYNRKINAHDKTKLKKMFVAMDQMFGTSKNFYIMYDKFHLDSAIFFVSALFGHYPDLIPELVGGRGTVIYNWSMDIGENQKLSLTNNHGFFKIKKYMNDLGTQWLYDTNKGNFVYDMFGVKKDRVKVGGKKSPKLPKMEKKTISPKDIASVDVLFKKVAAKLKKTGEKFPSENISYKR